MKTEKTSNSIPQRVEPEKVVSRPAVVASETAVQASRRNRRRILTGGVLVFFLFTIILCIVPVRYIPGLRYIAIHMGWSGERYPSFSFGRTLLTWMMEGEKVSVPEGGLAIFNQPFDRRVHQNGGQRSSLFNLRQANAARRAQGLSEDYIVGRYKGSQANTESVKRPISQWSQEAQRAAVQRQKSNDIFFGEDVSVVEQMAAQAADRTKGAADSARLLPKVNLKAAGRFSTDWLGQITDKARLTRVKGLEESVEKLKKGGPSSLTAVGGGFEEKDPKRDLATVWIFSEAAHKKAQQPMLKKQLAAAGYMSIELPKKVFDSFGVSSGVRIDGNEIVMNFQTEEERLKKEEECKEKTLAVNEKLRGINTQLEQGIKYVTTPGNLPTSCEEVDKIPTWKERFQQVAENCQSIQRELVPLKSGCGLTLANEGTCSTEVAVVLDIDNLSGTCQKLKEEENKCKEIESMGGVCDRSIIENLEKDRDELLDNIRPEDVLAVFDEEKGDFFPTADAPSSLK